MKRSVTLSVVTLAASAMVNPANAVINGTVTRPPPPGVGLPGPIWHFPSFPGVKFDHPGTGFFGTAVNPPSPTGGATGPTVLGSAVIPPAPQLPSNVP